LGWCDNTSTVQAINTGRSKSNRLMQIVRRVHLACIKYDMQLWMVHIPGVHNVIADHLSRGVLGARVGTWSLLPHVMEQWRSQARGFDMDAFDNAAGSTSQAPRFRSATSGTAIAEFQELRVWAFPPVSLVEQFFGEVRAWRAQAVTALVPASMTPTDGWDVWWTYPSGARLFHRPVGERMVPCKGTGVAWQVISMRV